MFLTNTTNVENQTTACGMNTGTRFVRPLYIGVEGAESETSYYKFAESDKEIQFRCSCGSNRAKLHWKMHEDEGKNDEYYEPASARFGRSCGSSTSKVPLRRRQKKTKRLEFPVPSRSSTGRFMAGSWPVICSSISPRRTQKAKKTTCFSIFVPQVGCGHKFKTNIHSVQLSSQDCPRKLRGIFTTLGLGVLPARPSILRHPVRIGAQRRSSSIESSSMVR